MTSSRAPGIFFAMGATGSVPASLNADASACRVVPPPPTAPARRLRLRRSRTHEFRDRARLVTVGDRKFLGREERDDLRAARRHDDLLLDARRRHAIGGRAIGLD